MNSNKAKDILKRYIAYRQGYRGAVTELASHVGNPDVLALDNKDHAVEYEIKVNRQDLRNELISARLAYGIDKPEHYVGIDNVSYHEGGGYWLKNNIATKDKRFSKLGKHRTYCHRYKRHPNDYIHNHVPHKFYFAVPTELAEFAKTFSKGLPYGIFDLDRMRVLRSATILTEQPTSSKVLSDMFARAINEYYKFPKGDPEQTEGALI